MHLSNVIIAVLIYWFLSLLKGSTDATVAGISLEGCFKNLLHYTTRHNLSDKNGPRHCFDECNNTEYIGLQKQDCFCNATRGAYATERGCNVSCPGDRNVSCGSDNTIYVYYYTAQTNINVYGEFGFVYLHVFKAIGDVHYTYEINGTNDITQKRPYICYDEPSKCDFGSVGVEMTWYEARTECLQHNKGLVPYRIATDETICTTGLLDGYFWIGMSWFKPAYAATISTTSVITMTQRTTTMRRTTAMATVIPTTSTNIKSESVTLYITTPVKPTSSGDKASTLIAVAVSLAVAVLFAVVSVVICWKIKCLSFKLHQERIETDENGQAFPEIDYFSHIPTLPSFPPCVPPGSTYLKIDRPSSSQQTNVHGDQPVEHDTSNQDRENGDNRQRKKKRKRERKGKKGRHKVRPANETEEMAVNNDIGSLHPNASENEGKQDKKKKKKKKKVRKTYDQEPDDNSAISGKTVVPHSLGHERNVSSAFEVTLTELIQDGTASNINTSEDWNKSTQDNMYLPKLQLPM